MSDSQSAVRHEAGYGFRPQVLTAEACSTVKALEGSDAGVKVTIQQYRQTVSRGDPGVIERVEGTVGRC